MMVIFIPISGVTESDVVRRTISVTPAVDETIRRIAEEEGSYSAAVARLVDEATRRAGKVEPPAYVGSGSGPRDLSRNVDKYMKRALERGRRR